MSRKKLTEQRFFSLLGLRLLDIEKRSGLDRKIFAKTLGYSASYLTQLITGVKKNPSERFYSSVCEKFNVDKLWLKSDQNYVISRNKKIKRTGEFKEKYTTSPDPIDQVMEGFKQLFKDQKKDIDELHDMCEKVLRRVSDLEEQLRKDMPRKVVNHEDITEKSAT